MTVKELICLLQEVDPERIVIMSKDAEGNDHSPLRVFWEGAYKARTEWCGDVGLEELTDDLKEEGYCEEDVVQGEKALILFPTN